MKSATCHHEWICEPPCGPTSRAVCKLCKATRTFNNVERDYMSYSGPDNIGAVRYGLRGGER